MKSKSNSQRAHSMKPHAFKKLSLEQLMGLADPPPVTTLYEWQGEKGEITVASRGLTLVLSRAVRENVRIAADIAVRVARQNPNRPVWYVNTYAGVDTMKEVMRGVIQNVGLAEPVPDPVFDRSPRAERDIEAELETFLPEDFMNIGPTPERPWETWKLSDPGDGKKHWFRLGDMANNDRQLAHARAQLFVKHERERIAAEKAEAAKIDAPPAPPPTDVLPNLHFFDIPLGEWDVKALVDAMSEENPENPHPTSPAAAGEEYDLNSPIVIINSFEYCPLNRSGKWRMARELLGMLESQAMSLVVFSQEVRQDIAVGLSGRGSIGLLAGRATHVCRMPDAFEHLIRSRKRANQPDNATVHEAQMHAPDTRKKVGRMTIAIKNEHGDVVEEVTGSPMSLVRHVGEVLLDV